MPSQDNLRWREKCTFYTIDDSTSELVNYSQIYIYNVCPILFRSAINYHQFKLVVLMFYAFKITLKQQDLFIILVLGCIEAALEVQK